MKDIDERHERILEQQEDLPPERHGERGKDRPAIPREDPGPEQDLNETGTRAGIDKADRMDAERDDEQEEGITRARRGSRAAPSDRPENEPPHPQDVNEIGETRG